MSVDPKATSAEPVSDSLTFGGVVPSLNAPTKGDLSLEEPTAEPQKLDISGVDSGRPAPREELLKDRTDKIHFSLGKDSPGPEVIREQLSSGQEASLRVTEARRKDLKDQELATQLVIEKASQGPLEAFGERMSEMEALVKYRPANNPDTIFERAFADKYVPLAEAMKGGDNVISQARGVNPAHVETTEEIARKLTTKQEIAKSAAEDMATRYEAQSFGSKAVDFAKGFVPGYAWFKTYNAVEGTPSGGFLEGDTWAEQIQHLYTLPADQMHTALRSTLDKLSEDNPGLAVEFANAVVSYTKTDAFIHNVGNVIDIATTLPGATIGAIKGLKASAGIATRRIATKEIEGQVVQAYKDHVAANAQPGATLANTMSVMGDLGKAALQTAVTKAKEILETKGNISLTRKEIRDVLPSIFNPEALVADGSNMSAKQTLELLAHLTYNASKVLDRVNDLTKVGRLPEEAMQVAIKEAQDSLKDRFKHVNDAVVDVVHNPPEETKLDRYLKAKGANMEGVPRVDPDAILKPEEIPANDPLREQLIKHYERKQAAKDEADATRRQLVEEGFLKETPKEAPVVQKKGGIQEFITTRPEESQSNTGSVTALLGNRSGDSFASRAQAFTWAKSIYGIHENDVEIIQRGDGFYIGVTKPWDETSPGVRQALINTKNTTPRQAHTLVGWLLGDGRLSPFQNENRITAVSGQQGLVSALKDMQKDLTSLSKKERSALKTVMEDNRVAIKDPETGETGVFHRTIKEFADNFERLNGRTPSPKETKAYFTAVQINDLEYLMRNNSLYREMSRLGLENFTLKTKVMKDSIPQFGETKPFYGKLVDDLPLADSDSKHPANVAIYKEGEEPQVQDLALMNTPERREYVESLKKEGYKIIQTGIPNRKPAGEIFGEEPINFIITKDHNSRALEHNPLPYREGWHQEYQHSWYIKQPTIRRVSNEDGSVTKHVYEGDVTAMAFHTEAEAKKFAKAFNEARVMLRDEKPGLAAFLEKNLPYTEKEFRRLFEAGEKDKPYFNMNDEFFHVPSGTAVIDAHGETLRSSYDNFNDTIRSPWNIYDQVDKKFVGQRDPLAHTILEKGSEENPVFQLATAETIDPMASLSRAMTNMVRNQYMLDYRTQAVETWVQEFGRYLEGNVSEQDLANNALHYVYNGNLQRKTVQNAAEIDAAEASRRAIKEFLGHSMSDASGVDRLKQGFLSTVYTHFGQDWSNFLAPKVLPAEVDPLKAMRGFAFHTTIGLFNPIQYWQNLQTTASAIAIAGPKHGWNGLKAGVLWQYLRLNQTDGVISKLAALSGWKEEDFREAWKAFSNSGRMFVEGEHAWKDDVAEPKFFQGTFGNFLDKGTIFFREGERGSRMVAYAAAYSEWRAANPGAKLTAEIQREILKRSDDLTFNMTRASATSWQQGVLSVPTQFLSYNARITETFIGNRLSTVEKARLIAANSALYGVPIGVGMPFAVGWNHYEDVRAGLLEKGVNVEDKTIQLLHDGILGAATAMITGRATNLSERSGPGGTSVFRDIWKGEKSVFEALLGVSGTKAYDAFTTVQPMMRWMVNAGQGTPENHPVFASDVMDVLRNVSSLDTATKLYIALTSGLMITKSGINYGDVNTPEAILAAVTGAVPRKISDEQMMMSLSRDRSKALKQIEKEIMKSHVEALKAAESGDEETFKARMSRIQSLWLMGGFRDDEKAASMSRIYDQISPAGDKIRHDWWMKHAPPEEVTPRYEQYIKQGNN